MPQFLTFVCPELDTTYEAVYHELAGYLEMDVDDALVRFAPDDAVARVRYHRRQQQRRHIQVDLAEFLGISVEDVFSAVSDDGARILLTALQARRSAGAGWEITVRPAEPALVPAMLDAS
jgi:thymidine kinase